MSIALIFTVIQSLVLAAVYFGDIGIEKPGRFGLTSQHLLILMGVYAFAFLIGCVGAYRRKTFNLLLIQAVLLLSMPLAYASLQPFAKLVDSRRELLNSNKKNQVTSDDAMDRLGLSAKMPYSKAKEVMKSNGWALDENENENSPYGKFPEVSCEEGPTVVCSIAWRKDNASVNLIVVSKSGNSDNLVVDGILSTH